MTFQHYAADCPLPTTAPARASPTSGFVNMGVGSSGPARLADLASTLPGAQPLTLITPRATGSGPKAKWQKVAIPIPPEVQECYDQLQIQLQNGTAPQVPTNGVFRSTSDQPPIPGSKAGYFLLQKQPHYKLKEPQEFVCFWYTSATRPGIQCHRYKTGRGEEVDWDSPKQIKLLNRYVTQEMQRAGCAKLRDDMSKRAWIEEEQQWIRVHVKEVLDSWPADVEKSRKQLAEKLALLLNQQFQGKSMVGTIRGQKQKQASVRPERTASALESECERLRIFKEYGVGGPRSRGDEPGEDDEGNGQVEEEVGGEDEQAKDSRAEMELE
ncbi:hypothetical protein MPH_05986 [Macrophomina phaseolina MS6]|uniref:Uncharacterized protein n=1 Tax=Macrophomina phaseolina (strain MS6) TaxID=1126212 RepID=K2RPU5_MACPH|nr:hypothetical protein MPH_05986 [Macrophomina phaseolina MS6]